MGFSLRKLVKDIGKPFVEAGKAVYDGQKKVIDEVYEGQQKFIADIGDSASDVAGSEGFAWALPFLAATTAEGRKSLASTWGQLASPWVGQYLGSDAQALYDAGLASFLDEGGVPSGPVDYGYSVNPTTGAMEYRPVSSAAGRSPNWWVVGGIVLAVVGLPVLLYLLLRRKGKR